MAWLAVDKDGDEFIFAECPTRYGEIWVNRFNFQDDIIDLPSGSIEKLIGKVLTWSDEPVELRDVEKKIVTLDGISVGQTLGVYDDGKITPSRRYTAEILEFIPISEIDGDLELLWDYCISEHPCLFSECQDFIIVAKTDESRDFPISYFARTIDGGWFSMGVLVRGKSGFYVDIMFNSGRLIADGDKH